MPLKTKRSVVDEIQENLAIDVCPASWPIGIGREFIGTYDIFNDRIILMDRADRNIKAESIQIDGLDDPAIEDHVDIVPEVESDEVEAPECWQIADL